MKILVTGGLGFIGSHTVVELQNEGFDVIAIDNLSNSSESVLDGIERITGKKPIFEKMDLRDKAAVQNFFQKYNDVVGVIHFAASKAVGESVENPLLYYENNINALVYILQELSKLPAQILFLVPRVRFTDKPKKCQLPKMLLFNQQCRLMETQSKLAKRL
jgi:UDP-glucose 4-epimerase